MRAFGRPRRESENRGKVELFRPVFKKFVAAFPRFKKYESDWGYRDDSAPIYLDVNRFDPEALSGLKQIVEKEGPEYRGVVAQLSAHIELLLKPDGKPIAKLDLLETAIIAYLKRGIIEGWLFVKDLKAGTVQPMLVDSVKYHPASGRGDNRTPAHTTLSLYYWKKGKAHHHSVSWEQNDLRGGQRVSQLLSEENLLKESKELIALYEEGEKRFLEWRVQLGEQFLGTGEFSTGGWREHDSELKGTRIVVDDRCDAIENRWATQIFYDFDEDDDDAEATVIEETDKEYTRVPIAPWIWCFNLDSHRGGWVHIDSMKPYVYRPELREKLILPAEHSDLIDALTGDMDILMEDIVTGKSGGTTIICQGRSGTGKTLTAEVYSEIIKRPLYRVHSGQLGINAESVEEALKNALNNAKRWRAALLIDEADVFLMQRGEDLERNAVVGVFLRVLEYYDGLMFLTTNRLDAIDDAILSRCIARIKFDAPEEAERVKLWLTLSEVYGIEKSIKPLAPKLARGFKATGRDIKGLIRLSIKYSRQRKKPITFESVKRMATFLGL